MDQVAVAARFGLLRYDSVESHDSVPNNATQHTTQPSLVLKAYALALRKCLTLQEDLSRSGQAIFIAGPQQKGIPCGAEQAYANEQLYQHANAVQSDNVVAFNSNKGNFFEYLRGYVAMIKDQSKPNAEKRTEKENAYAKAKAAAEEEYQDLRKKWKDFSEGSPGLSFQSFVAGDFGKSYRLLCGIRDDCLAGLTANDLHRQVQILDSAKTQWEYRQGANMLCALEDVTLERINAKLSRDANTMYRPFHALSGFRNDAMNWRDSFSQEIANPRHFELDFKAAHKQSWASLGFPQFDHLKPDNDENDLAQLTGWIVKVSFTRMNSYRVTRGMWNVEDFRGTLGELMPDAPAKYREPIYKTTYLLLGYGVQIRVQLPNSLVNGTDFNTNKANFLPEILEDLPLSVSDFKNEMQTPKPENDAYPVLLAVLAEKC